MELMLTESEVELLRGMLNADRKTLLMEIARTDNRTMREGLKEREELLKGIRITSYNVCYTKLLRADVVRQSRRPLVGRRCRIRREAVRVYSR